MLIDSNIIICAAKPEYENIRRFIARHNPVVSAISYVEVLGYQALLEEEKQLYQVFFLATTVLPLDQPVLDQAVLLRQRKRMSLGDALVAATALVHGHTLVTRNVKDFSAIPSLHLFDPFDADLEGMKNT